MPTDLELKALLEGLRSDPAAGVMIPSAGRSKSADGAAGTAPVNGKDIADLALLMFCTGARIGEVGALRRSDVDFDVQTVPISGSLTGDSPPAHWKRGARRAKISPDRISQRRCSLGSTGCRPPRRPLARAHTFAHWLGGSIKPIFITIQLSRGVIAISATLVIEKVQATKK